jgi:hypothetical protein
VLGAILGYNHAAGDYQLVGSGADFGIFFMDRVSGGEMVG